jgi:hypothetical protein
MERGLPVPRQKISHPTCFVCHPYEIPTEFSQDNKKNYIGIKKKKNGSIACTRYDNIKDVMQVYLT